MQSLYRIYLDCYNRALEGRALPSYPPTDTKSSWLKAMATGYHQGKMVAASMSFVDFDVHMTRAMEGVKDELL